MRERERIQAVTFDVGGTLITPWPSVGHVYARVAAGHGVAADPERLTRQFFAAVAAVREFDYSHAGWFRLVRASFDGMGEVSEPMFEAIYDSFSTHDAWRVFDDVTPCLEALRERGIRRAVISNWDTRLRTTLGSLGLDRWFEVITVSGELGVNKPAREIFERTARELDLPPGAILHIGDSRREDFEGARQAGLHAVHLDRSGRTLDAMATMAHLPELVCGDR